MGLINRLRLAKLVGLMRPVVGQTRRLGLRREVTMSERVATARWRTAAAGRGAEEGVREREGATRARQQGQVLLNLTSHSRMHLRTVTGVQGEVTY